MFTGKKRIAELEEALRKSENVARHKDTQIEYLVRELRNMDDKIFTMSQQPTWDRMRPHFAELTNEMMVRKTVESKRITELLRPELTATYANKPLKQIKGS